MPGPIDKVAAPDFADFAALADNLPQLCWLARPDAYVFWYNRRWTDYTGYGLSDMQGSGWEAVVDPAHLDRVVTGFRRSFELGEDWEDTYPLRRRDGAWRWFLSRANPSRDAEGRIVRWIGTNTDITETVARDQRLRDEERRYRSLVDAVAQIVWSAQATGAMPAGNAAWCAFTGQDEAQSVGEGWLSAIHPDDREVTMATWQQALARRSLYEIEHRVRRHDGEWRYMQARAAPVLDDAGGVTEWIGIHGDITERKLIEHELEAAKEAAEQANLAKSQFIANMSHELRTPLSAVIGYSEMLEEEVEDAGQTHLLKDLRKINDAARHLLSLISDVLDLSKIEANRMTVFAEEFAVDTLLQQVEATVQSLMAKKENRFRVELQGELGSMNTDQVKLRQCLFNLLGNAAKFTEQGEIVLHVRRDAEQGGEWLEFAVQDSGIGMNEEQVQRLFERFVQADPSTTRRFGGTGLGLAITRGFAVLMGGSIDVRSVEGSGSTFILRIPAFLPDADEQTGAAADEAVVAAHDPDTVLIIDDDPATRDLVGRFLEREGFRVRSAADGQSGLALARALQPRVVLLDVMMPRMDGWSVLSAIRADEALAATPVVMISFVHEEGLAVSLGATDYLVKPIEWKELAAAMAPFRGAAPGDVLVVDDDEGNRRRLAGMLAREGLPARTAENGAEALAALELQTPSVILLDLMMPQMDGFEFLRRLRADERWDAVGVIVLTAKDITPSEQATLRGKVDPGDEQGQHRSRRTCAAVAGLCAQTACGGRSPGHRGTRSPHDTGIGRRADDNDPAGRGPRGDLGFPVASPEAPRLRCAARA